MAQAMLSKQQTFGSSVRATHRINRSRAVIPVRALARPQDQITGTASLLASAVVLGLVPSASAQESTAVESTAVESAVSSLIDLVKAAGALTQTGVDAISSGVKVVQEGYETAAPVLKQGLDIVSPVVQQAYKATADAAGPALRAAGPTLSAVPAEAGKLVKASGVDPKTVADTTALIVKTTEQGVAAATPVVTQAVDFLSSKDPVTLGEYGIGALVLYFLTGPIVGVVTGGLRGYAGDLTAATALNCLVNEPGTVLVDVRSAKDKEAGGVADVPTYATSRVIEVEYAATEDKKLRNLLKDPSFIEAQITALQIANLKKLSKGTKVILMDKSGSQSKTVAKELGKYGFGQVYLISGGFDGRSGWVQSKLQVKPYAGVSYGSGTVFGAVNGALRTVSTRTLGNKRALPAPRS